MLATVKVGCIGPGIAERAIGPLCATITPGSKLHKRVLQALWWYAWVSERLCNRGVNLLLRQRR